MNTNLDLLWQGLEISASFGSLDWEKFYFFTDQMGQNMGFNMAFVRVPLGLS